MSAERIDQAKEAERLLSLLPVSMHEDEVIGKAQVYATLALVEQQRIANLIALGQAVAGDGSRPFRHLIMIPVNEFDVMAVAEIREALGLT